VYSGRDKEKEEDVLLPFISLDVTLHLFIPALNGGSKERVGWQGSRAGNIE